jgi:hypothetical protein
MTTVFAALQEALRERNDLRAEVRALRASLALEVANRKQWEAWCLGAQEAARALRAKLAGKKAA